MSAADFSLLLTLQEHDNELAQLHHRATHLPTDSEIAALDVRKREIVRDIADSRASAAALDVRQQDLEVQIHAIDEKIDHAKKTLYGGTITSPRELQGYEADIASLTKHRSELEDVELEILVEREPLDELLAQTDLAIADIDASRVVLAARAASERSTIAESAEEVAAKRQSLSAQISAEVVATYEKVRSSNKGVGAARLEHGTCMACRLKLPAVEVDRIRQLSSDVLVRCEECGAILVR